MAGPGPPGSDPAPTLPVLALHGFTGTGEDFAALASAAGGSWTCPDLPGHGSRHAAPPEAFPPGQWAASLLATLPRRLHAVGYSLGGRLLLHLLTQAPERFASAVLLGVGPELGDPADRARRRESDETWIQRLRAEPLPAFLHAWYQQPVLRSLGEADSRVLRERRERQLAADPVGWARSLAYHGKGALEPAADRWPSLRFPILVLAGEDDPTFRARGADLAALLPRARAESLGGAGHAPHLEQPEATAGRLRAFWQEAEDEPGTSPESTGGSRRSG